MAEGLDFTDANARAVVVVGIPFPNVKDVQVMEKRAYNSQAHPSRRLLGGEEWYRLQAFRALNQAVGRCLRHVFDYGAVVLCDERFLGGDTQRSLPKWLRPALAHHGDFASSLASLRGFFEQIEADPPGKAVMEARAAARAAAQQADAAEAAKAAAAWEVHGAAAREAAEQMGLAPIFGADDGDGDWQGPMAPLPPRARQPKRRRGRGGGAAAAGGDRAAAGAGAAGEQPAAAAAAPARKLRRRPLGSLKDINDLAEFQFSGEARAERAAPRRTDSKARGGRRAQVLFGLACQLAKTLLLHPCGFSKPFLSFALLSRLSQGNLLPPPRKRVVIDSDDEKEEAEQGGAGAGGAARGGAGAAGGSDDEAEGEEDEYGSDEDEYYDDDQVRCSPATCVEKIEHASTVLCAGA